MNLNLYTIKDTKAETFDRPWPAPNHIVAIRSTKQEAKRVDPANMLNSNPEDFELYCVGTFDTDTGILEGNLTKLADITTLIQE